MSIRDAAEKLRAELKRDPDGTPARIHIAAVALLDEVAKVLASPTVTVPAATPIQRPAELRSTTADSTLIEKLNKAMRDD
jgi:hypothetical protein